MRDATAETGCAAAPEIAGAVELDLAHTVEGKLSNVEHDMLYKNSSKTIGQIGRELGVSWVLEGSVRQWDGRVRVSVRLIEVRDQTQQWATTFESDLGDVLQLQVQIAEAIGRELAVAWPPAAPTPPIQTASVDPRALTAFLKGRHSFNQLTASSLRKAIGDFNEALRVAPDYAPAYVGLADSYLMEGFTSASGFDAWAQAATYARKAADQDDWFELIVSYRASGFQDERVGARVRLKPDTTCGNFIYTATARLRPAAAPR
ncbi:MAG: hypothetical protein HYY76_03485 [Acidobacteria bacterium]|nr:hypothetical protein [Acidobacteriota bacterium]